MSKKNQPIIIIKKNTENSSEHHGGSWKVAFADFMTAMMAFFLVMWLISQSEEVKKEVADYFSTPSVVEYNFKNYGVLLTLEKLFMDLINDPLKFVQSFIRPMNFTPDVMKMGTAKVIQEHLVKELGGFTENIQSNPDRIYFKIPDYFLFEPGTSKSTKEFLEIISKVQKITSSLEDSVIKIHSQIHLYSLFNSNKDKENEKALMEKAKKIANQRMDLISKAIHKTLKNETVELLGKSSSFKPSIDIDYDSSDSKSSYGRWIEIEIEKKHLKENEKPKQKNKNPNLPEKVDPSHQNKKWISPEFQPVIEKTGEKKVKTPTEDQPHEINMETSRFQDVAPIELNEKKDTKEELKIHTIEIKKEERKKENLEENVIDKEGFEKPILNPLDEVNIVN